MEDSADAHDQPEPPPKQKREGVLVVLARRFLGVVDRNPVVKATAILWVVAWSLFQPWDSCRRERSEAQRGGWAEPPKVHVSFSAGECSVVNADPRPLREVTILFRHYIVTDPCFIPTAGSRFEWAPLAAAHELQPRERLSTSLEPEDLLTYCSNASLPPDLCIVGDGCELFVECVVRYHRFADLAPFTVSRYAIVEDDWETLHGGPPFSVRNDDGFLRENQRWRDAWRCFAREKPRHDRRFSGMGRVMSSDPLATN